MTSVSLSSQNPLSQMLAAQQANGATAVSASAADDDAFEGAITGTSSNAATSLTGSTTGTLDSQTLQALLGLTQTDPSSDENQQGSARGTHHHHHHGGGAQQPASAASNSSNSANDPTASIAELPANASATNGDASDDLASLVG